MVSLTNNCFFVPSILVYSIHVYTNYCVYLSVCVKREIDRERETERERKRER